MYFKVIHFFKKNIIMNLQNELKEKFIDQKIYPGIRQM